MPIIRLRLLGSLALVGEDDSSIRSILTRPKRFALLTYLAASHPASECRRDTLVALFWPELDDEHARKALRQSLYGLRQALGLGTLTGRGEELVGVDPGRLWCDAAAFTAAVASGRDADALTWYAGPFLEGFHLSGAPEFERWLEAERQRLQLRATEAAWRLADGAAGRGDRLAARRWAERALEVEAYDEQCLRHYMELMTALGQPAASIRAYEVFRDRLAQDLGLHPAAETTALFERVKSEPIAAAAAPTAHDARVWEVYPPPVWSPVPPERGQQARPRTARWAVRVAALAAVALLVYAGAAYLRAAGSRDGVTRSLAVLPLQNRSGDPAQEYLADGMTEALIGQLGQIGIKVTSLTSALTYKRGAATIPEIAADLDVAAVVEGSVARAEDRFRVSARLVDATSDQVLWSREYDRQFGDIFTIQSEMAQDIARALDLELSPLEERRIEEQPTGSAEAYSYYLQGNDYLRRESRRDRELAEQLYERAVTIDPGFASALERLVYVRTFLLLGAFDTVRLAAARDALERLRSLGPDLDETHAAEGWYAFYGELDYERAVREFEIVRRRRPGDPAALWAVGRVQWHSARWEQGAATLRQLLEIDPRNPEVARTLGLVLKGLRRFDEAGHYFDRAVSLAPDNHFYYFEKWWLLTMGYGDTAGARQLVEAAAPYVRQEEHAWQQGLLAEYRRDFPAAIRGFGAWPRPGRVKYELLAMFADRAGEAGLAAIYADSLERMAAVRLENATRLGNSAQQAVAHYDLGVSSSIRGRHEEAVAHGEEGLRLAPLGSYFGAPQMAKTLVWIYMRSGRYDEAIRLLEPLVQIPGGETYHGLRLNPRYDGLRDHPQWDALLRKAQRAAGRRS